eukprot:TRINITY_DN496_c0_g2_i1.p1 TRINITY_DN496_c0_g2~~TRINITY_DN496_c0_g2_i1.p1  ORF type:complete len:1137 (+),score=278.85 TRINITY_DN496_c0_g2_i1:69-3479(+)
MAATAVALESSVFRFCSPPLQSSNSSNFNGVNAVSTKSTFRLKGRRKSERICPTARGGQVRAEAAGEVEEVVETKFDGRAFRRALNKNDAEMLAKLSEEYTKEAETSLTVPEDDTVRAVLFDMDGVLCDSEDRSREAAVTLFAEMGVAVKAEDFVPFMGTGEANFLGGVARVYDVKDFDPDKAKQRFFQIYIDKYATPNSGLGYEGALELVVKCKEAGLKVAVASSADRVKVDANLAAAGLADLRFDAIVSADKFERLKPAPDIFLAAAEALGLPPRKCVVIEDALAGVEAATAAGMRCIAVTTTLSEQALSEAQPLLTKQDISFITLEDILSLSYNSDHASAGKGKAAQNEPEEIAGDWEGTGLEAPLTLPGGFTTTRRQALRFSSLAVGLSSTAFILTHLKALSYASPKALLNSVFGSTSTMPVRTVDTGRVSQLKEFIKSLERRGGGEQVPEFAAGLEWLNSPPLQLSKELRGKVVLLDFWTYCCINCMHVLPDLAYLEAKYKDQPVVVVGVHSAKFDNEKDSEAIRKAVLRYDVAHPVVNDGEMTMWRAIGVNSWPTLAVLSPAGKLLGMLAGEGHRQDLDELVEAALEYYGEQGQLDRRPIPMSPEKDKDARIASSPLRFPGKLATDLRNNRLFVSDSNNHRIVVLDLAGNFQLQVGGAGGEGFRDGSLQTAAFRRPQGLAYDPLRNVLYVADTENHALRAIDFVNETVQTLAGDGTKGRDYAGGRKGKDQELNSPWDVALDASSSQLYIAMAGQHQIWRYDIEGGTSGVFSGNGYERNQNGRSGKDTAYAQPSGLSLSADGSEMYEADSESSSIRAINLVTGGSRLLAGGDSLFSDNLFQFGDKDGAGSTAELQHPLGVLYNPENGLVYLTDSYNHKVKSLNPATKEVRTVVGTGAAGFRDGAGGEAQLSEPAGLALGPNGQIFVADTNNSLIRVLDTSTGTAQLSTLDLSSIPPPPPPLSTSGRRRLRRRAPVEAEVVETAALTGANGELRIHVSIPGGYHFTKGAVSRFEAAVEGEGDDEGGVRLEPASGVIEERAGAELEAAASLRFSRAAQLTADATVLVTCRVYYCKDDGVCLYAPVTFRVPVTAGSGGEAAGGDQILALDYTVVPRDSSSSDSSSSNRTGVFGK